MKSGQKSTPFSVCEIPKKELAIVDVFIFHHCPLTKFFSWVNFWIIYLASNFSLTMEMVNTVCLGFSHECSEFSQSSYFLEFGVKYLESFSVFYVHSWLKCKQSIYTHLTMHFTRHLYVLFYRLSVGIILA